MDEAISALKGVVAMDEAISAVKEGRLSLRGAADKFSVRRSTLQDRVTGKHGSRHGRPPVLSEEEETHLADHLKLSSTAGFLWTRGTACAFAKELLGRKGATSFISDRSNSWWRKFKSRQGGLESPAYLRAIGAGSVGKAPLREAVDDHFEALKKVIVDNKITEMTFWTFGEHTFSLDTGRKVAAPAAATKPVEESANTDQPKPTLKPASKAAAKAAKNANKEKSESVPVGICVNAAGQSLPPHVIYRVAQLLPPMIANGPAGTLYSLCPEGDEEVSSKFFLSWFEKNFLEHTKREKCQLLLVESSVSVLSLRLLELAQASNVVLLALPAKATALMHPLHSVLQRLSDTYAEVAEAAQVLKGDQPIQLTDFPAVLRESFLQTVIPMSIVDGFRRTGTLPIDRSCIPDTSLAPAPSADWPPVGKSRQPSMTTSLLSCIQPMMTSVDVGWYDAQIAAVLSLGDDGTPQLQASVPNGGSVPLGVAASSSSSHASGAFSQLPCNAFPTGAAAAVSAAPGTAAFAPCSFSSSLSAVSPPSTTAVPETITSLSASVMTASSATAAAATTLAAMPLTARIPFAP